MKPFNLKEAKAGKSVCTRDGRSVRIICFDRNCIGISGNPYPIVALVETDNSENIFVYQSNGKSSATDKMPQFDLMMASEKKEGWINIYPSTNSAYVCSSGCYVYKTKDEAVRASDEERITTIKIKWNENLTD